MFSSNAESIVAQSEAVKSFRAPGAVPRTSTYALNYATLPFVKELADRGMPGRVVAAFSNLVTASTRYEEREQDYQEGHGLECDTPDHPLSAAVMVDLAVMDHSTDQGLL